jgi:hypothetical protein
MQLWLKQRELRLDLFVRVIPGTRLQRPTQAAKQQTSSTPSIRSCVALIPKIAQHLKTTMYNHQGLNQSLYLFD